MVAAQNDGVILGVKVARNAPPINHLLFADDSVFFWKEKGSTSRELRAILDRYCQASGQVINKAKSAILLCPSTTMKVASNCFKDFEASPTVPLGNYLGLPTEFGKSKKHIFNKVVEHV
ncbi:uncharacterized protein LOC141601468 [Silene latifolia]|uniref:uncharacterized protein LOC141601468 n=1 Tax=Silene latifolia TaxID=37657 RepID=UPI003D781465